MVVLYDGGLLDAWSYFVLDIVLMVLLDSHIVEQQLLDDLEDNLPTDKVDNIEQLKDCSVADVNNLEDNMLNSHTVVEVAIPIGEMVLDSCNKSMNA